MRTPFHPKSGDRSDRRAPRRSPSPVRWATLCALAWVAGCNYSFTAGSGFPEHVRTIAVLPFDNETPRFEVAQEVHEALLRELPRKLGVRPASEDAADAVVTGTVERYRLGATSYSRADEGDGVEVGQREVTVQVAVQVLDRQGNQFLVDESVTGLGQYLDASGTEEEGRRLAIERLVQKIVDGVQSNW